MDMISGRKLKLMASRGESATRSQSAAQAVRAIFAKYGAVVDNAKYFHAGKGIWRRYTLANDRKRTSKLTTSKVIWRKSPRKWDMEGIDTKVPSTKKSTKPKTEKKAVRKSIPEPEYNVARKGITKAEYEAMIERARQYNLAKKSKKNKSKRFLNNQKQKEAIAKMHKDRKEYLDSYYNPKVKISEKDLSNITNW